MQFVNNHTRAGKNGKIITCKYCFTSNLVYHFCWSAITCSKCKELVNKEDFILNFETRIVLIEKHCGFIIHKKQ